MIKQRNPSIISGISGFTLIELSIVMVIIGLIVSGILVGNAVIKQAVLRKQITQINRIEAGIQNFRTKYACLPGDCADPTVIDGYIRDAVTYVGDGNGFLPQTWNANENTGFWVHLNASRMINDALVTNAAPTVGNIITPMMSSNAQGAINAYGSITYAQNVLEFDTIATTPAGALNFEQIKYIDKKLDDGIAASGNVRSTGYGSGATTVYAAVPSFPLLVSNKNGDDQCITGGIYSGTATNKECNMVYILGNN